LQDVAGCRDGRPAAKQSPDEPSNARQKPHRIAEPVVDDLSVHHVTSFLEELALLAA
jgi:hypothetical protein